MGQRVRQVNFEYWISLGLWQLTLPSPGVLCQTLPFASSLLVMFAGRARGIAFLEYCRSKVCFFLFSLWSPLFCGKTLSQRFSLLPNILFRLSQFTSYRKLNTRTRTSVSQVSMSWKPSFVRFLFLGATLQWRTCRSRFYHATL